MPYLLIIDKLYYNKFTTLMKGECNMNFGWLPSLGLYILGIGFIGVSFKSYLNKTAPSTKEKIDALLAKEHEAQFTRSVKLPDEFFIQVDISLYPKVDQKECMQCYETLVGYAKRQMVNLQGKTNLELKQTYGAQTLESISDYERNYYEFLNISVQYGQILYENEYIVEARQALENCIRYHCDISKCYYLLIDIYKKQSDTEALNRLRPVIESEMQHSPFLHKVLERL